MLVSAAISIEHKDTCWVGTECQSGEGSASVHSVHLLARFSVFCRFEILCR